MFVGDAYMYAHSFLQAVCSMFITFCLFLCCKIRVCKEESVQAYLHRPCGQYISLLSVWLFDFACGTPDPPVSAQSTLVTQGR